MNAVPLPAAHPRPPRQVFVFGTGDMGQFGLGTLVLDEIPQPRLHSWFESAAESGILGGPGAGVERICTGGMHTLVVDEQGYVWSWGINDHASLGRPTSNVLDPDNPQEILEAEILETQPMILQSLVDEGFRAVDVAAGDSVSVALGDRGEIRVWGSFRASDGLLGFDGKPGSPKTQSIPIALPSLSNITFVQVACGTDHVLALTAQGTVYVWGNGQQAQLGRRIIERRKVNGLSPERLALRRIKLIGTGSYHSFAVTETGVVYAWGLNNMRQTGVSVELGGDEDIIWSPTEVTALNPERLGNGRRVVQICGGEHHTIFLLSDGQVYGCGRCDGFEVGLADDHPAMIELRRRTPSSDSDILDEFIAEPTHIAFPPPPTARKPNPPVPAYSRSLSISPPSNPIAHISVGTRHNLAVSRNGDIYSWGVGSSCQLGLGATVDSQQVPTRVVCEALDSWFVEDAAAGGQHCMLLAVPV
ncbi:RCC1/BLIP-II [Rickenella mellea]|uniref:RCC1/BLIP-II n=1 Tax=Rickenella mellea TaxID=50990 RepID=A0A4Y7QGV7_9AGAM|nr:RCC1/BLIP-II [Rickenella mellea]